MPLTTSSRAWSLIVVVRQLINVGVLISLPPIRVAKRRNPALRGILNKDLFPSEPAIQSYAKSPGCTYIGYLFPRLIEIDPKIAFSKPNGVLKLIGLLPEAVRKVSFNAGTVRVSY